MDYDKQQITGKDEVLSLSGDEGTVTRKSLILSGFFDVIRIVKNDLTQVLTQK